MKQPLYDMPMDAVKAMLGGGMKFNVWNKLVNIAYMLRVAFLSLTDMVWGKI